jgi:hypothetical protein
MKILKIVKTIIGDAEAREFLYELAVALKDFRITPTERKKLFKELMDAVGSITGSK